MLTQHFRSCVVALRAAGSPSPCTLDDNDLPVCYVHTNCPMQSFCFAFSVSALVLRVIETWLPLQCVIFSIHPVLATLGIHFYQTTKNGLSDSVLAAYPRSPTLACTF